MLLKRSSVAASGRAAKAAIFAALGDQTRLLLLARLLNGKQQQSIAELTEDFEITRQAITKHLRVLERAKIVHSVRIGRENLFELNLHRLNEAREYLEQVSAQWDQSLAGLKSFVEHEEETTFQLPSKMRSKT